MVYNTESSLENILKGNHETIECKYNSSLINKKKKTNLNNYKRTFIIWINCQNLSTTNIDTLTNFLNCS